MLGPGIGGTGNPDRESSATVSRLNGTADRDANAANRRPVAFGRVPVLSRSAVSLTPSRTRRRDRQIAVSADMGYGEAEGVQITDESRDERMA
jgi:hypothetical protein